MASRRFGGRYVKISAATNGDNELVAAATQGIIVVLNFLLVGGGTVTAKFQSSAGAGATDLTGAMPLVAQTVVPPGEAPEYGHFHTVAGESLNLNLSAGVQVSGWLVYDVVRSDYPF